jgi:cytochrome P450
MLYTHPKILAQVRAEIEAAEKAGHLSSVIRYEETRQHLPLIVACIKESLRLFPPAPQFLVRIVPPEGRTIDGHFVPGDTEIATYSYCVQRSLSLYGPDADEFKPERWMESEKRNFELDAVQATFGVGFRGCMGKDIAMMELHKLLPEVSTADNLLIAGEDTTNQHRLSADLTSSSRTRVDTLLTVELLTTKTLPVNSS